MEPPRGGFSLWGWLKDLFSPPPPKAPTRRSLGEQEVRTIAEFSRHYKLTFHRPELLKLALTHRSYLSVTGQGPQESNERLEFLGDSVLGLVTSEFLYLKNPHEHEGQLTKTKSLLVSKAILSRRALAMGLGRFVLMSHSEVESGGRQRLSIIADAFEAVVGAIYLDQGFDAARQFIDQWLLREAREIAADKRHTNYKSHLQEYVQSTFHTHPVYRIRSEMGPDHSKHFMVEVVVGKRSLGQGRGRNKKEAEQAAARDALDRVDPSRLPLQDESESRPGRAAPPGGEALATVGNAAVEDEVDLEEGDELELRGRRRGRRGGRGRRERAGESPTTDEAGESDSHPAPPQVTVAASPPARSPQPRVPTAPLSSPPPVAPRRERSIVVREEPAASPEIEPEPPAYEEDFDEEVGRPEGPLEERRIDPYALDDSEGRHEDALEVVGAETDTGPEPGEEVLTGMETEPSEITRRDGGAPAAEGMLGVQLRETPESEDGEFTPEPGTLFSHEAGPGEAPQSSPEDRGPRFGRRSRRRSR